MTNKGRRGGGSDVGVLGTAVPLEVWGVSPYYVVVVHLFVVGSAVSQTDDLWVKKKTPLNLATISSDSRWNDSQIHGILITSIWKKAHRKHLEREGVGGALEKKIGS